MMSRLTKLSSWAAQVQVECFCGIKWCKSYGWSTRRTGPRFSSTVFARLPFSLDVTILTLCLGWVVIIMKKYASGREKEMKQDIIMPTKFTQIYVWLKNSFEFDLKTNLPTSATQIWGDLRWKQRRFDKIWGSFNINMVQQIIKVHSNTRPSTTQELND